MMYLVKANRSPMNFTVIATGRSVALAVKESVWLDEEDFRSSDVQRLIQKNELIFVKSE